MNVGEWVSTWLNVITQPGERVFEEERAKPQAQISTALIWVALVALLSGLITWMAAQTIVNNAGIMELVTDLARQVGLPAQSVAQLQSLPGLIPQPGIGGLISGILFSMLGFLVFVGLLQLTAKVLGGTGNFGKYAYLIAAFHVPLNIASALVGLVPWVGGCVSLIIWIYELVLAYYATRVEHKLSSGRAITVVLIPVILVLLLVGCLLTALAGLLVSLANMGQ